MNEVNRGELLTYVQRACDEITKGYHEQTGNTRIKFRVLELIDSENSKLENDTDIVRKSAMLYDEYEGNEEYIHIPDIKQMLTNLQEYIVIGIEDIETGELEGVTTIKYHENDMENVNPYYPRNNTKYFEVTGVIVKQRESMVNKGLGTSMYEACFLGLQQFARIHPTENYKMNVVIDCTNIKSLYAAQNAINNISARNLIGRGKKINLSLAGIYVVRDPNTKSLVEAPTFVFESDLQEKTIQKTLNKPSIIFEYKKPKTNRSNSREYIDLKHTILRRIKRIKKARRFETQGKIGLKIASDLLKNIQKEDFLINRNLDENAGYVEFVDLAAKEVSIEMMKLKTNGVENIGKKRKAKRDIDQFIGPMPNVRVRLPKLDMDEER